MFSKDLSFSLFLFPFSLESSTLTLDRDDMLYRDAYFMRKDISRNTIAEEAAVVSKTDSHPQTQQQLRRGEKERDEWLNRDAIHGGSFFEGRKGIRETQSKEERAWTSNNGKSKTDSRTDSSISDRNSIITNKPITPPSISGQFRRSFHALVNIREQQTMMQRRQHRDQSFNISLPPWEVGPEALRLPRYRKVARSTRSDPASDQIE